LISSEKVPQGKGVPVANAGRPIAGNLSWNPKTEDSET